MSQLKLQRDASGASVTAKNQDGLSTVMSARGWDECIESKRDFGVKVVGQGLFDTTRPCCVSAWLAPKQSWRLRGPCNW